MSNSNSNKPRRPGDSDRYMILGQNGTGKTVLGVNALAYRSYNRMPWIIANYKADEHLDSLPGVREIGPNERLPTSPGLYMVRPEPEPGSLDNLLQQAYMRGANNGGRANVGFYIDEGTEIGQHSLPFRRVLTQGRSMRIPVICLSQRPVWLSKYAFTEAKYFSLFPLNDTNDRRHVAGWIKGLGVNYDETLAEYESYYFDCGKRRLAKMGPALHPDELLDVFDRRRPRRLKRVG